MRDRILLLASRSVMEHIEEIIQKLISQGYDPVYIWDAKPNEEDPDHMHAFSTHLIILEGEIEIRMHGKTVVLKSKEEIDIPKEKTHSAKVGKKGCKYIVAEKH